MPPRRDAPLSSFGQEKDVPVTARADEPESRTVTEIVTSVNKLLAADASLTNVWIRGEISNLTMHSSGHWYFSLKDESSMLSAAMFRGANGRVKFRPEEGMEVLARGSVKVYASRSQLQIVVDELRPVGAGALQLAFEQLKRKLEGEGLFAQQRKRALPSYPTRVGIVTSLNAAALRDLVRVATQRHPGIQLLVCGARVQGEGAAAEVATAIARLNETDCDVIIVGRGGGSIEDLWAFNEEAVVRAVAGSRIPIVSAVGHETDTTLCDYAADVRAATPSNAAELVVPDAEGILGALGEADGRMEGALLRLVPELRQRVDDMLERAEDGMRNTIRQESELLAMRGERLDALSPLKTLARGYAVAQKGARVLRSVDDAPAGSDIKLTLPDGTLDARVTKSTKKEDAP